MAQKDDEDEILLDDLEKDIEMQEYLTGQDDFTGMNEWGEYA